jgi:BMFP domain-containing protein YqiC
MAMKKHVGKVITEVKRQAKQQAKQSLKIFESIERDTFAKAKTFASILPSSDDAKKMTNDKILSSLKKLGVPTQAEVSALRARVEKLEAELALLSEKN